MDHLRTLTHDADPYPKVPCEGLPAYVPVDNFSDYLQEHGHHNLKKQLDDAGNPFKWPSEGPSSVLAILQAWLYFGTLYEVSVAGNKPTVEMDGFVTDVGPDKISPGAKEITSASLDHFVQGHVGSLKPGLGHAADKAARFRQLHAVLDQVCASTKRLYQPFREQVERGCGEKQQHAAGFLAEPPPTLRVLLSIKVLGCTVDNALHDRLGDETIAKWMAEAPAAGGGTNEAGDGPGT